MPTACAMIPDNPRLQIVADQKLGEALGSQRTLSRLGECAFRPRSALDLRHAPGFELGATRVIRRSTCEPLPALKGAAVPSGTPRGITTVPYIFVRISISSIRIS